MKHVWRLEGADGEGAYQHIADFEAYQRGMAKAGFADSSKHPSPSEDSPALAKIMKGVGIQGFFGFIRLADLGEPHDPCDWRVGCKDKDQLRYWFPPTVARVVKQAKVDLTLWEVDDDHYAEGEHQVLFARDKARLVERLPVTELYHDERIAHAA